MFLEIITFIQGVTNNTLSIQIFRSCYLNSSYWMTWCIYKCKPKSSFSYVYSNLLRNHCLNKLYKSYLLLCIRRGPIRTEEPRNSWQTWVSGSVSPPGPLLVWQWVTGAWMSLTNSSRTNQTACHSYTILLSIWWVTESVAYCTVKDHTFSTYFLCCIGFFSWINRTDEGRWFNSSYYVMCQLV